MDLLSLIKSVNKIAIAAFIITFLFTIYELVLMIKERAKRKKISVPDFKEEKNINIKTASIKHPKPKELKKPLDRRMLLVLIILLVIFGIFAALGISISEDKTSPQGQIPDKTVIKYVESDGIKIYDENWNESIGKNNSPSPGDTIYIGVATIEGIDINKARIRINSNTWALDDETSAFNKEHKVYYRKYTIPPNESSIQIEAQLYSLEDGWLGK